MTSARRHVIKFNVYSWEERATLNADCFALFCEWYDGASPAPLSPGAARMVVIDFTDWQHLTWPVCAHSGSTWRAARGGGGDTNSNEQVIPIIRIMLRFYFRLPLQPKL